MTWMEFTIRLGVALLLGAAIGIERQWRQRMAGLKTNALVSIGAALFVMLSSLTPGESSPTRIAAQVVSGIGFLGGGVILREGLSVRGLNTAATLWCAAAVGCLCGTGRLSESFIGALAVLGTNVFLRPLAHSINRQPIKNTELETYYRCTVVCRSEDEIHVRALLLQMVNNGLMLRALSSEDLDNPAKLEVKADLMIQDRNDLLLEQIVSQLSLEPGVSAVSWEILVEDAGTTRPMSPLTHSVKFPSGT